MRPSFIIKAGGATAVIALLVASCNKDVNVDRQVEIKDLGNKAMVQVYNATVGSAGSLIGVDGALVNNTAPMTYGSAFPTTTYFIAEPGVRNFVISPSSTTSTQVPISFPTAVQANTRYNMFVYDTITSPKQLTVKTVIEIPLDTTARLRFANFVFSKTAVPAVDIYSLKRKANVFTNIGTTQVTEFVPFAAAMNDTLLVRETGTTNQLAALNGINPGRKRSYTVVFRGRYQTTTGTTARGLTTLTNY